MAHIIFSVETPETSLALNSCLRAIDGAERQKPNLGLRLLTRHDRCGPDWMGSEGYGLRVTARGWE